MAQLAILLLDLLAGRASAQLVCDAINVVQAFETPENVAKVTALLRQIGARLEPALEKEVRAVARYFETHPWASEHAGNPDMGGNEQAGGPGPAVMPDEPDAAVELGGNVPAKFGDGPPVVTRPEPEDGSDPRP